MTFNVMEYRSCRKQFQKGMDGDQYVPFGIEAARHRSQRVFGHFLNFMNIANIVTVHIQSTGRKGTFAVDMCMANKQ